MAAGVPASEISDAAGLSPLSMRADLTSMLMPFFPEDSGRQEYAAVIDGHDVVMRSETADGSLATASDRKILNFLAATLARAIRSGMEPSRHMQIETRMLVDALRADGVCGGAEYTRIIERLDRLMDTIVETEAPLGDNIVRRRRFRWIDAYEHDDRCTEGGRKILALQISLSEDAFYLFTRSLGYDLAAEDFHAITASRSSNWRIYEICFAMLAQSQESCVIIPIAELRERVPMRSELKVFKSRTLRAAFKSIAGTPQMSSKISVDLVKAVDDRFDEIGFSDRAPLETIHVRVRRGTSPMPRLSVLLPGLSAAAGRAPR